MAALAYALLPITGLFAFLKGADRRTRFHGLQALVLGFVWPALTFVASMAGVAVTQVVFGAGGLTWLGFFFLTALGRDPGLPWISGALRALAEEPPA